MPISGKGPVVPDDAEVLSRQEIVARLGTARDLAQQRQGDAALLLAWAAIEATLRLVAQQQRITLEEQQPAYVIKRLYTLGALSRPAYDVLQHGLEKRNTIAHGFRPGRAEPTLVDSLVNLVKQLLQARSADVAM